MKPVEYFNGNCNIMVQPVSYLLNPSQDFANSMATGPQDELYTALNRFNSHLPDNVKLAVTPSWNWRPGTIPKFREYIHNKGLKPKMKASSLSHMLRRAREQSRYFQYWERQLGEIESLKYSLKAEGYSPNVDIDEFKEKLSNIVNRITKQIEDVNKMTNGNISIDVILGGLHNPRNATMYVDILIENMEISVISGDTCIQKVNLEPIHIIAAMNIRKFFRAIETKTLSYRPALKGMYLSDTLSRQSGGRTHTTYFPYISNPYYSREREIMQYSSVCLDRYTDEVNKAFLTLNWVNMSMSLMSWSQYYHTTHSNPYNNLSKLKLGMPKEYSLEYKHAAGRRGDCEDTMHALYNLNWSVQSEDDIKLTTIMHNQCKDIGCQFADSCDSYQYQENAITGWNNEDIKAVTEGFIGHLMERDCEDVKQAFVYELGEPSPRIGEDWWTCAYIKCRIHHNIDSLLNRIHSIIIKIDNIKPKIHIDESLLAGSEEEKRQAVLRWATGGH